MERTSCTEIAATPQRVCRALTDTVESAAWYYGTGIESTFEPGAPYRYAFPDGRTAIEGVVNAAEAPHTLDMTFRAAWSEAVAADDPSHVTWTITSHGAQCRVCVTHSGLIAGSATDREVVPGWPELLRRLKSHTEEGNIVWWEVETAEVEAFQRFHAEMWGWTFAPAFEGTELHSDYWVIQRDGADVGGLQRAASAAKSTMSRIYLRVADLEAALTRVEALGGTIERGRVSLGTQWFALFRDPAGVLFGLWTVNPSK